jgi:glycosyltransferase involved in cell wall biosynthesis
MAGGARSISILIPTLNAGRAFGTVLHRIMGQGRTPLEILVLDRGSSDPTRHIVSQFPAARLVEVPAGGGAGAWNRGVELATGELAVFVEADAVPADGDWLDRLTEPLDDPRVGAAYGRQRAHAGRNPIGALRLERRFPEDAQWRRARFGDPVTLNTLQFSIANCVVRRSVWRGIRFNERLPLGADLEWARQVLLASFTVAYVPGAIVDRQRLDSVHDVFHQAVLSGWTDAFHDPAAGSVLQPADPLIAATAWHLIRRWRWDQLPRLALEDFAFRYGYRLGRRLNRLPRRLRSRFAPELDSLPARAEWSESERAA